MYPRCDLKFKMYFKMIESPAAIYSDQTSLKSDGRSDNENGLARLQRVNPGRKSFGRSERRFRFVIYAKIYHPTMATQPLSKNAQKKAAKEKEKAEKAALREEKERKERELVSASDTSKHLYGNISSSFFENQSSAELSTLYDAKEGQDVTVDVRIHNTRIQSAKLAFLVLRNGPYTIQAVVGEGGANNISRQMVKWSAGINVESLVRLSGLVQKPAEPITSTSISDLEIQVKSIYIISEAAEKLPVQVKDCMRPPPVGEDNQEENEVDNQGLPVVSLNARLNNRVLDARTAANSAIFEIQSGISNLFIEFMREHDFRWIHSSKMVEAATEGGSGVFEIKYFERKAYLTQSPQFFKQMAIAGDFQRVCEIGPVFRAENSNTHRHLTEVSAQSFFVMPPTFGKSDRSCSLRGSTSRW